MKNKELASLFARIGDALEIKGETAFKVIAYRKASRILEDLTEDIEKVVEEKRLQKIPGIGSGIAKKIAGRSEEEVYKILGLPLVPPELREDRGEVEAALKNKLPRIVELSDIRADLHIHSHYSDGNLTLKELAELAQGMGYEYIAICDHSQSVRYANGLSPERLLEQVEEIDRLNKEFKNFKILKGTEVDILHEGKLDYSDKILKKLDLVIAAIHSGFKKNVTERILKAMENPYVTIIAHPSGRLISKREGYDVDLEKIIQGAKKSGKALELNAFYDRLDLNEFYLKKAKENSIKIGIGTDTHYASGFQMMRFGVGIARRAWLEKKDIINCLSLTIFQNLLKE